MMRGLIASALRLRVPVVALSVVLIIVGIRTARDAPFDVFPEFAPPLVEIQTEAPGLSTADVEALVSVPLEAAMNGVPGLKTLRSKSVLGLSSVVLIFADGTDRLSARQLVQERLARVAVTLPAAAHPPVILSPLSSLSRVMKIGDVVEDALAGRADDAGQVDGASEAHVDSRRRERRDLGRARSPDSSPGRPRAPARQQRDPRRGHHRDARRHVGHRRRVRRNAQSAPGRGARAGGHVSAAIWQRCRFRRGPGEARAPWHPAPSAGSATSPRSPKGFRHRSATASSTTGPAFSSSSRSSRTAIRCRSRATSRAALEALRPGLSGVDVDSTIFRPATFIEMSIGNLNRALLIGCLLVVFVLAIFLWDWRTAVISLMAIPLSLLAAASSSATAAARSTRWSSPGSSSRSARSSTTRLSMSRTSCGGCG